MDPYLLLAVAEGCEPGIVTALLDPSVEPEALLDEARAAASAAPPREPADVDATDAHDASPHRLALPPRVRRRLLAPDLEQRAAHWLQLAAQNGLLVLTPRDDRYPELLRECALRPNALFVRGDPAALAATPAIAVVGSRTPTPYGQDAAQQFAAGLAQAGCAIWSGLARGIDAIAHRACLDANSPTVAVLASGLDRIYPSEHAELAASIVQRGGCLVAELPPESHAQRGHFPRRNRILAAAESVLVVEAGRTSGSLQTARFCAEQGRPVFAVPGPWSSERSRGCHDLLREGAQVATDPSDLLRDLGVTAHVEQGAANALQTSADENAVLRCLSQGPRPADLVQRESGLDRAQFLKARFALELRGALRAMPGDLLAAARKGDVSR
jgi:DNA processing protein